jgi:hypothetical protein
MEKAFSYINGATMSDFIVTTGGTYKVEVTNSSGCSKTSAGTVITVPCKEINSSAGNELFCEVHPNPSSDNFMLKLSELIDENIVIHVFDIAGRKLNLQGRTFSSNEMSIKLPNPGVFTAIVSNGNNRHVLKLIKIK